MESDHLDRLESLFTAAAEIPPAQRSRFLDATCAGDRALRLEIESLLEADRFGTAPIELAVEGEAADLLESQTFSGERLGSYRVLQQIGRGGMGAVYLAERDDDQYRHRAAIKLIKRGMDTAAVLLRFRRERQILANLDHPYIARLIDGGSSADGRPFLVMEYVEGAPIDRHCREKGLSIEDRCRLFLKVCEAVAYAHRHLVVHRDLKPGNILITADGLPKLLDFGVAKLLDPAEPAGETTMLAGRPLTPDYASPEQVRGQTISTASDVYSLGAILYELLSGVKAHRMESANPREWERTICDGAVEFPSAVSVDRLTGRKLRGDLDNIVMAALRQDPARRYPSVEHLAEDIQRHLAARPIHARQDSAWYRTAKFARRHRLGLLATGLVATSLVAGMVVAERERQHAERRLAQLLKVSNRSLSDLSLLLERLPGALPARQEVVHTTIDMLEALARDAGNDQRLRLPLAKAYLKLGELQGNSEASNLGDAAGALHSFRAGATLLGAPGQLHPESLPVWVDLQMQVGILLQNGGQQHEASVVFRAVRDAILQHGDGSLDILRRRAAVYLWLARAADVPQALQWARQCVSETETLLHQYPHDSDLQLDLSTAYVLAGFELLTLGRTGETAEFYRRALDLREALVREHPNDGVYRRDLALLYEHNAVINGSALEPENLRRPDLARAYFRKAGVLEEARMADPADHLARTDYAAYLVKAASVRPGTPRQVAESVGWLQTALPMYESLVVAQPDVAQHRVHLTQVHQLLGERLLAGGKRQDAIREYRKALEVADGVVAGHAQTETIFYAALEAEQGLVRALTQSGDRVGAVDHANRALERAGRVRPPGVQSRLARPEANVTLAQVHLAFQEWDDAARFAQTAIEETLAIPEAGRRAPELLADARTVLAAAKQRR